MSKKRGSEDRYKEASDSRHTHGDEYYGRDKLKHSGHREKEDRKRQRDRDSRDRNEHRMRKDRNGRRSRSVSNLSDLSSLSRSSDEDEKASRRVVSEHVAKAEIDKFRENDKKIKREKEEKCRKKDVMKQLETPEQKRVRRLAKKEAKEKKRKQLLGWDEEYLGYTNTDNPFGDSNLLNTFVWTKKYEKLGMKEIDPVEIERENKIKLEENKIELEKVKERRLEREREREARLDEVADAQRQKEAEQFMEWEKQEDTFHLKQAKLRSKLRLMEGRAKPIDLLARYINAFRKPTEDEKEGEEIEIPFKLVEPYLCLNGLRIHDLQDLQEDIKVYMQHAEDHELSYWNDIKIIVEDELHKMIKFQANDGQSRRDGRDGINPAVNTEVVEIFKGKTPAQLFALQNQIEGKINSRSEGIDISYWESLFYKLKAHMARARLREKHEENILIKETRDKQKKVSKPSSDTHQDSEETEETISESVGDQDHNETNAKVNAETLRIDNCVSDYISQGYSPIRIPFSQIESGIPFIDVNEDIINLESDREKVLSSITRAKDARGLSSMELAFEKEAKKEMTKEEVCFNKEVQINQSKDVLSWSDKYRPRKPRYFNRVHTGFEWNKYNQTHYDVDNPPPKIVQGYKFNIFFPDLIDKSRTPTYTVTPCPDNRDFAVIRFTAGPPYEDIAFKIVNREWNFSYKSGFRCQFHNNILQLWFHFKRYRYRR